MTKGNNCPRKSPSTTGRMDGITRIIRSSTTASRTTWQSASRFIRRAGNEGKAIYRFGEEDCLGDKNLHVYDEAAFIGVLVLRILK